MDSATNITINIVEPGSDVPVPDTGLFTHGIGGVEASIIATVSIIVLSVIVTFFIVQKKKGLHIAKPSKRASFFLGLLAVITSISTFTGLTLNSIYNHTNAKEGDLTVTTEDANLTIEVGDEPVFAVLPVDVKVEEAAPAGYTLTAYADNTDLVSTTDDTNIIPMVATSEGELAALKDNTYGLSTAKPESKDDKTYTLLSTAADNPTFITDKDYKATEANDTATVYYGFYITPDIPYGTYKSSDIYYNATTNSSKVIFNGNGLYFNSNPEQTTNDVEYLTGITEKTAKYSHTPNVNDEGEASGIVGYHGGDILNKVITIPGASRINIKLSYGGGYISGGYPAGFVSFWQGSHPDYTTGNNIGDAIKTCGTSDVTDGKFYGNRNNENAIITTECELEGNAATFAYWTSGGGPSSGAIYGYYATVTGYDADGNIIYLPGNTQIGGGYQDPSQDLPYIFLGWNEDKDATTAVYESKNDIELNLPLIKGKTTELYAIWQHATKITFNGNGSTSGEMQDKIIPAGTSTYVPSGNYSRDGYIYTGWNTKPDGTGTSYSPYQSFTVASDKSEVITLYAQWAPATTIVYDGNGGEGNQQQQAIRAGETQSIWGNWGHFSKDGYMFSHWNTKPDGTGTSYYQGNQFTASDQSTVIILYAQWTDKAMLDTGTTVNAKLKRLAGNSSAEWYTGDTSATTIARASTLPADFVPTNDNTISIDGSANPVYAWYDTDTTAIYYYTESDKIIMNPDSSNMFYNFRNLSDATSIADWDTSKVTDMKWMFSGAGSNATTWSIGDLSSWDTSNVTDMSVMFSSAGSNATTWSIGDLSSWDTSKVTNMNGMFSGAGSNATTLSLDLSSWDTSNVTNMGGMFSYAGYNATTLSLDLSSWDTSKVTNMNGMFQYTGYNATTLSLDLSSWDTSKVTSMVYMFLYTGSNATTLSLDLSSWDTSKVTNMYGMFSSAGSNATTWSVTIPPKTGDIDNTTSAFYGQDSSIYASPPNNRFFTLATQANSNTTNTTGSLNSVNNAGSPNQDNSSGNRSAYATEDAEEIENTENDDSTSSDATSAPSRQEPLGEYQSSTTVSTEDTNIAIPLLIVTSITLGTSALVLLIYKSRQREDE